MRINKTGTPIYVTERHGKGVSIFQGSSKVMLSTVEAKALLQALTEITSGGGHEKTPGGDG
jgi:hypothetical protein